MSQSLINIFTPIRNKKYPVADITGSAVVKSAYVTCGFSCTRSGGPSRVSWGVDRGKLGSTRFYDEVCVVNTWKVARGKHIFWVEISTSTGDEREEIGFAVFI